MQKVHNDFTEDSRTAPTGAISAQRTRQQQKEVLRMTKKNGTNGHKSNGNIIGFPVGGRDGTKTDSESDKDTTRESAFAEAERRTRQAEQGLSAGTDLTGSDSYVLEQALSSVMHLHAHTPDDAYTVRALGTEREGHGILIDDNGLVLTIGYLIVEADQVRLTTNQGQIIEGNVIAYDYDSGFGLVRAFDTPDIPVMPLGSSADLEIGQKMVLGGSGGRKNSVATKIFSISEFVGSWEYKVKNAIFTFPAHPVWGGAALIDEQGRLTGVASLHVERIDEDGDMVAGNMTVPIDLLKPVMDDLTRLGRVNRPPRPWIGMLTAEAQEFLIVAELVEGGPAEQAGVETGDIILALNGHMVANLGDLYDRLWRLDPPDTFGGSHANLTVYRDDETLEIDIKTANRYDFLKISRPH